MISNVLGLIICYQCGGETQDHVIKHLVSDGTSSSSYDEINISLVYGP